MTDKPDLTAIPIHVLAEEIRARSCAVVVFSPEDVFERFNGPSLDAVRWLEGKTNRLEDRMSECGNRALDELLQDDGLYYDEDDVEYDDASTVDEGERE